MSSLAAKERVSELARRGGVTEARKADRAPEREGARQIQSRRSVKAPCYPSSIGLSSAL